MTQHSPRVSIGLPVYNGQSYLAETVPAILAQTYGDFELLIADNASTDETGEIARALAADDGRIRYHRHPANVGLARNYNFVAQELAGEYFKWASADDICEPDFLRRCVGALDSEPETVLAYTRSRFIDQLGGPLEVTDRGFDLRSDSVYERLQYVITAGAWFNCIMGLLRASALRKTHLMPSLPGGDFVMIGELRAGIRSLLRGSARAGGSQ